MSLNFKSIVEYQIDEIVYDKLTRELVRIIGIQYKIGKLGYDAKTTFLDHKEKIHYYVENKVNNGCRQPWEIDKIDVYEDEELNDEYLNFFFRK